MFFSEKLCLHGTGYFKNSPGIPNSDGVAGGDPEFPDGEIAGSHPVIITIFPTFSYIFSKVRPFFKKYEGGLSLS